MIAKVQPDRQRSGSFKRLLKYLTEERDADTGEPLLRGDVVLSDNLAGLDTVSVQMEGIAFLNPRCKDALCHYELSWPPGERPTRPQWIDCALHTLKALGYREHQFMVVAHDDKKHFHIHIMMNKVHPETFKAHTPYRNWLTLDAAMRVLEAKYGWTHTAGPTRWDEQSKQAVHTSCSERNALRTARQHPTGAAAKFEHYHDEESLQTYIRREMASRVRQLLIRGNVTWDDLHLLLSKAHLRLETFSAATSLERSIVRRRNPLLDRGHRPQQPFNRPSHIRHDITDVIPHSGRNARRNDGLTAPL